MVIEGLCEGVKSKKLQEKLCDADFGNEELTRDRNIEICRKCEMTEVHLKNKEPVGVNSYSSARGRHRFTG